MNQTTKELLNLIQKSTSPYHTVAASKELLLANGFTQLSLGEDWNLAPESKYFVTVFDSSLFAFRTGTAGSRGLKIAAAHTDFPCFRLKPAAAVISARRAGTTATWDQMNKHFGLMQMPIVTSQYWNMVHGACPEDVRRDLEGLQTMRTLGNNMAFFINCKNLGLKMGLRLPDTEAPVHTNFIRS